MIDLFSLVISSGHVQEVNIDTFPGYKSQHAFNREGASVHKVTIEEIFIFGGRDSIEFKNVDEIIVLTMNISTDCDLLLIFNFVAD